MHWITGITLNNYRAFKSSYSTIEIPAGNHFLIYGENGSGKSSIYSAIKDFFNSSADTSKQFDVNYFSQIEGNDTGTIALKIAELDANKNVTAENPFVFGKPDTQSTHRIQSIKLANKVKGFLDYKRMLQTHFIQTLPNQSPNLFSLIVEDILADHLVNIKGYSGVSTSELLSEWKKIEIPMNENDARKRSFKIARNNMPDFESSLKELLTKVFSELRRIIQQYFDPKLEIDVRLSEIKFDWNTRKIIKELYLDVKYAGKAIPSYQTFINEARLSALAISIYLAALKTYPIAASELRVLFLDDIFIGLDTSNRVPLLKILKQEFMANGFQIFISTYDREWFEVARNWFEVEKCQFKYLEMYIEDNIDPTTPDYPVIILPVDNITKANEYFKAKRYPEAGYCLRKACESIVKNLLPDVYKVTTDGQVLTELDGLMNQLVKLYEESNIPKPPDLIDLIRIFKKLVLNPSSHNDFKSPLYRNEIRTTFELAEKLQNLPKIERRLVLKSGRILTINYPEHDYIMEIELVGNYFITEYNNQKHGSVVKYRIKKWSNHNIEFGKGNNGNINPLPQLKIDEIISQVRDLDEIFQGIHREIGGSPPIDLLNSVTVGRLGTLRDLLM
ncbi:MAG: hypothetical protein C0417_10325 [Chlorobiaceae bacterium]|nr:hypothetical protein [Chlorobiaceae bacterium]